jgi:hypothetical protein
MAERRRVGLALGLALAACLPATACAVDNGGRTSAPAAPAMSTDRAPLQAVAASVGERSRTCTGADLAASIGAFGAEMSHPFLTVELTNRSASSCRVRGYPRLTVFASYRQHPLPSGDIAVRHGATYERPDPGPHWVTIAPARFASFTVGTATAYPGRQVVIHRFAVGIGTSGQRLQVRTSMMASAPPGKPVPVAETALRSGMAHG